MNMAGTLKRAGTTAKTISASQDAPIRPRIACTRSGPLHPGNDVDADEFRCGIADQLRQHQRDLEIQRIVPAVDMGETCRRKRLAECVHREIGAETRKRGEGGERKDDASLSQREGVRGMSIL